MLTPLEGLQRYLNAYSHQSEIELGRYIAQIPLEERICHLCHQGVESEERSICYCAFFYEIREDTIASFKQGFALLCKVLEYED